MDHKNLRKGLIKFIILSLILPNLLVAGALFPIRGAKGMLSEMKSRGYLPGPKSQFLIKLKKGESVKYIITVPFYLSETAVGVVGETSVKRMKVLVSTLSSREDNKGRLIVGEEVESNLFVTEIKEKSYYYLVEISLEESDGDGYNSIDLIYGFKTIALAKEDPVTKEIYYDHSDEKLLFSKPKKRETPTPSDTGRSPCTTFDHGKNCMDR